MVSLELSETAVQIPQPFISLRIYYFPHNTRPVRRPRIRWEDAVQKDALQILGTRGWRRRAENREEWRQLLREAKAQKGLSAMDGWMDLLFAAVFLIYFQSTHKHT
jgi:hypothetical protein